MALGNITYQTVVDTVKNWIKSNCTNITNYSGINASVKNGYSYTIGSSGSNAYTESATASLSSPLTGAVSSSVVDTDMTNYLSSIGASSYLSRNISADNFLQFMNDMVCFCCAKIAFVASQTGNANSSSVRYMVYYSGNTSYNFKLSITNSSATNYLIKAADANNIINYLVDAIKQNSGSMRVLTCKYTVSLS